MLGLLFEFLLDFFFGKLARQALQILDSTLHREICLSSKGNHTLGKGFIILYHQSVSDHQEVNVVK